MDAARARGAVFTPHPIARSLARVALAGRPAPTSVCDPAAGDGRLLAAVADAVVGPRPELFGADVDDDAWSRGPLGARPDVHFAHGDALGRGRELWPEAATGFDLVIGNPPFLSQLARTTSRSGAERERVARLGVSGVADTAAAFLVQACEMLAPGGRVAMIMPLSFLSTRDAALARRRVLESCRLSGIWVSAGRVFPGADVETCAVLLDRVEGDPSPTDEVRRWSGGGWEAARARHADPGGLHGAATWSHLVADLLARTPEVALDGGAGRLADLATATAGHRDQFYGLAEVVEEVDGVVAGRSDGRAPLVTSGAIEPGRLRWREETARFAGRRRLRPAVAPARLDASTPLARWVAARRVPKVLVATQTRVLEAVADPTGEWIPSTPVVSVECPPDAIWRVLAVLLAPPVSAWARRHFAGAALSPGAIKLSARQVLEVPLPTFETPWDEAARTLERDHSTADGGVGLDAVLGAGDLMCEAYAVSPEVAVWWSSHLHGAGVTRP